MVFAASFQAPVIFFCQNNQWAISEPVGLQAHVQIADRAPGFGIPSIRVDGNDVLAVMAATRVALDRARHGGGPTFIEAVTYRMGPHTTADDPTRYRRCQRAGGLGGEGPDRPCPGACWNARACSRNELEAQVGAKADAVASEMRAGCIGLPDPEPLDVFDHVYSTPNSWLDRQRGPLRPLPGFLRRSRRGPLEEGAR